MFLSAKLSALSAALEGPPGESMMQCFLHNVVSSCESTVCVCAMHMFAHKQCTGTSAHHSLRHRGSSWLP
jgi:hypothetical protein